MTAYTNPSNYSPRNKGERHWSSKGEALYIGDRPDDAKWCMAVVDGEPSSNELVALAWGYSPEGVAGRAALIAGSPDLAAENERLREALCWIAANYATHMSHEDFRVEAMVRAAKALSQEGK